VTDGIATDGIATRAPVPASVTPPCQDVAVETEQSGDHLLDALRLLTGRPDADFRDGQRQAIEALTRDRSRVLVVQRTGWGKSAVYFLSTHLLRTEGLGPTLLISPLLALMRNQIEAADRLGLRCMSVNSSSSTTVTELHDRLRDDTVDLVLVSPERLANPEFSGRIMPLVGARPGLIVIDEVHCISDWGHDFRPDYRRIGRLVDRLCGSSVPILGCTATANDRVVSDVAEQLGAELTTVRGPLRRDGLALGVVHLDRQAERLAWLADAVPELRGSGIVYCLTVRDTVNVAAWLSARGLAVEPYYGGLDDVLRLEAEDKLKRNQIKALVATTALGMGYDKPDLGFVIHFQAPGSAVAYYQQVGRAGRALDSSVGVLLHGAEDEQIQDYFIDQAFAPAEVVDDVLGVFDAADAPRSISEAQGELNIRRGTLESVLKQLDVDGAVRRVGGTTYERTLQSWTYPAARVEAVTRARRAEQQAMREYLASDECRMVYLARLLDDISGEPCGSCDNCTGERSDRQLPVGLVAEAEQFLLRRPVEIHGKKQGIAKDERIEDGRALSMWGDAGWGRLVKAGKQQTGRFDDRLVDALADLIDTWRPDPAPHWVTAVPSIRHPDLVDGLAERLAARFGLPYERCVQRVEQRPEQKHQQNSAYQRLNVEGAFVIDGPVPNTTVLLIDDVVDSGWTLSEIGRLLRRAGSGPVLPVALACSSGRD